MRRKRAAVLAAVLIVMLVAGVGTWWFVHNWRDVTFNWSERSETERRIKDYADEMGISYSAYPESLIELLERNPETEEFVLNYPFRQEQEIDLSDYDLSEGVPLFMQWDTRWGYIEYGSDVAGLTGCGPTCLAMAGYYVTGDEKFSPDRMYAFSEDNGYYAKGYGSSWTLISEGGVRLGLDVTEIPLVEKRITDNLEVGNPIICSMGPGDFTDSGHYIVLVGYEDGFIRVNDPNSYENSEKLWTYEEIEDQIRNLWVIR